MVTRPPLRPPLTGLLLLAALLLAGCGAVQLDQRDRKRIDTLNMHLRSLDGTLNEVATSFNQLQATLEKQSSGTRHAAQELKGISKSLALFEEVLRQNGLMQDGEGQEEDDEEGEPSEDETTASIPPVAFPERPGS